MDVKLLLRAQRDRVAGLVCLALGALSLLIGWIGVSGNALVYKQLAYVVSGGLFGIALVGIGTTLLLSADLADEWRKLDRVEDALRGRLDAGPGPAPVRDEPLTTADEPVLSEPVRPGRRGSAASRGATDDVLEPPRRARPAARS